MITTVSVIGYIIFSSWSPWLMKTFQKLVQALYTTWKEYKAQHPELEGRPKHIIAPKLQKYEDDTLQFVLNL